jgi:tetratricopeptide (TPR) repeat protein
MGEVFLARDLTLDRLVAIKFLITPGDEQARRRLLSEARSAAALDHPSICTIHEVVTDLDCGDFIVMQYVEGDTLAHRLRHGRLPPAEVLAAVTPLFQALAVAHRAGVIHRDIKPQNIILPPAGLPKLLDFGIAKRLPVESDTDATTTSQLTGEGDIVGTLAYMSPEQIQGRPVDARSDLFSLGCVLYECLTGARPFAGASRAEAIGQLLHVDPEAPSTIVPGVSPAYDAMCADLLRKSPAERFQSADEVLGAIRSLSPTSRSTDSWGVSGGGRVSTVITRLGRVAPRHWGLVAAVLVIIVAGISWVWLGGSSLPTAAPEAVRWFDRGVEKLREGSYTGAQSALVEAVRISPDFVQAHLRLAEARAELDDSAGAQEALLRVNALLPSTSRLPEDDQLRLDAIRSSVLRDHERAIAAYRKLADRAGSVASAWLDVGRAEDAAGRRVAALGHYAHAVSLDGQYAAAHQRLGVLQAQGGQSAAGLASLDEAIRLHQVNSNVEGEAEATLRKAIILTDRREVDAARLALDRVAAISADPGFVSLRLRALFGRARVAQAEGQFQDAERFARDAVDGAMSARMLTIAADGLRALATTLGAQGKYDDADAQFARAIALAAEQKAGRTEMQARLQQASIRLGQFRYADVIAMAEAPRRFFTERRYVRNEAEAKSILARAHEGLEQYDDARQLASDVLALATSIEDPVLTTQSLDNLAGQSEWLGQLTEALALRERLETITRANNDHATLGFDLVNRASLLILLGRGAEGENLLDEVTQAIAAGRTGYAGRQRRVALMRTLRASIEGRFGEVDGLARLAAGSESRPAGDTALFARVLVEHARARLGTSRTAVDAIAGWPRAASTPALGRELTYWTAQTLLLRRSPALAFAVAEMAWSAPPARANLELRWRLAALAAEAQALIPGSGGGATMRTAAQEDLRSLLQQWAAPGAIYLARPDLAALRKDLK